MSEIQVCEGIWRTRCGQRVVVTQCEPVDGQRWTDGVRRYSDDGRYYLSDRGAGEDLVAFVGPLPDKSQQDQTAEIERRLAAVIKQNEQAQRYVSDANESLNEKAAKIERLQARLAEHVAEIDRLKADLKIVERGRDLANADADHLRAEFTAAQQLRSENESLTVRLQRAEMVAAEALQKWETTEQVCLRIITALAGVRS